MSSHDDNHKVTEIRRHFGILAVIQVEKCYLKIGTSLTEHFATFSNMDMPTIRSTPLNPLYGEAHLLSFSIHCKNILKFTLFNFLP